MNLNRYIRTVPDWPKPGIQFRDITTLIADPAGLAECVEGLLAHYRGLDFDKVVGIESRGFVFGAILAERLGKGLVFARKPGKLPAATISESYTLEYGTNTIEMHLDAIQPGERTIVIDDLCATGGTALAAVKLVERLGGKVLEVGFVIDLPDLDGSTKIRAAGYPTFALTEFAGD